MTSVAPVLRARSRPCRIAVEGDDSPGRLGDGSGDHAEPDRSAAGDDDDVPEREAGTLDHMERARERLGEGGVVGGERRRHTVDSGTDG